MRFSAALRAQNTLAVEFRSRLFRCSDEALLDFPFVHRDGRLATILLPVQAGPRAKLAAFRIQEYFRYWYGRAQKPPRDVRLPIRTASPGGSGSQVVLSLEPGTERRVAVEGPRLSIAAPDEDALHDAVLDVLRALDARYSYADQLPPTALNRRLVLANTVLEPK